jgi:nitroimidazol reductase NimA-like FMN-containing flavoprotein (pyridoxamine 5'-phosphate oxidase superfamily)
MAKYHMQKSEREITDPILMKNVIRGGKFLTLALCRQNKPYVLTLNYGYEEASNCLYFHTAKRGLKIDIIQANPAVCGTIVEDHGYIESLCSHAYRSVVFTGTIEILDKFEDKKAGLEIMLNHLEKQPDVVKQRLLASNGTYQNVLIMRLKIDELTGKEGRVTKKEGINGF